MTKLSKNYGNVSKNPSIFVTASKRERSDRSKYKLIQEHKNLPPPLLTADLGNIYDQKYKVDYKEGIVNVAPVSPSFLHHNLESDSQIETSMFQTSLTPVISWKSSLPETFRASGKELSKASPSLTILSNVPRMTTVLTSTEANISRYNQPAVWQSGERRGLDPKRLSTRRSQIIQLMPRPVIPATLSSTKENQKIERKNITLDLEDEIKKRQETNIKSLKKKKEASDHPISDSNKNLLSSINPSSNYNSTILQRFPAGEEQIASLTHLIQGLSTSRLGAWFDGKDPKNIHSPKEKSGLKHQRGPLLNNKTMDFQLKRNLPGNPLNSPSNSSHLRGKITLGKNDKPGVQSIDFQRDNFSEEYYTPTTANHWFLMPVQGWFSLSIVLSALLFLVIIVCAFLYNQLKRDKKTLEMVLAPNSYTLAKCSDPLHHEVCGCHGVSTLSFARSPSRSGEAAGFILARPSTTSYSSHAKEDTRASPSTLAHDQCSSLQSMGEQEDKLDSFSIFNNQMLKYPEETSPSPPPLLPKRNSALWKPEPNERLSRGLPLSASSLQIHLSPQTNFSTTMESDDQLPGLLSSHSTVGDLQGGRKELRRTASESRRCYHKETRLNLSRSETQHHSEQASTRSHSSHCLFSTGC